MYFLVYDLSHFWIYPLILHLYSVSSRDRLVVRTLRCGRSNPGSNPGHGSDFFVDLFQTILERVEREHHSQESVGGIVVSIAAFQAVDPGSIPGRRIDFFVGKLILHTGIIYSIIFEKYNSLRSAVGSASVS